MQFDCRAPQFVTQIDRNERSGFLRQFAMQLVCSLLQRMGAAKAVVDDIGPSGTAAMHTIRPRPYIRESAVISTVGESLVPLVRFNKIKGFCNYGFPENRPGKPMGSHTTPSRIPFSTRPGILAKRFNAPVTFLLSHDQP